MSNMSSITSRINREADFQARRERFSATEFAASAPAIDPAAPLAAPPRLTRSNVLAGAVPPAERTATERARRPAVDRIREYGITVVPQLLQTPGYARARFAAESSAGWHPLRVAAEVDARMVRQTILTTVPSPEYEVLVDESLLIRRCGPPGVRRQQLGRLVAIAGLPTVTVRVLPYDARIEAFHLPTSAFSLHRFTRGSEVVLVETEVRVVRFTGADEVARYQLLYDRIWSAAFGVEESIDLLINARDDPAEDP